MKELQPYTLAWWLRKLEHADICTLAETYEEQERYMRLYKWIKKRIINKYGE